MPSDLLERPASLVHRYYDPTTEQFVSVDPDVDSTNQPYEYGDDNPVNNSDATGLDTFGECVGVQGTAAGVLSGSLTVCVVRTKNQRQVGITVTGSDPDLVTAGSSLVNFVNSKGGLEHLFAFNASLELQNSNASCLSELGNKFSVFNSSIGIPWGASYSHATDREGISVYTYGVGFDPGFNVSSGTEYTAVTIETGAVARDINGIFNEQSSEGQPVMPFFIG